MWQFASDVLVVRNLKNGIFLGNSDMRHEKVTRQKKIMSHSEMMEELLWRRDFWKLVLKYLNHNMHYLIPYTSHQYVLKYSVKSHYFITIWRTPNR